MKILGIDPGTAIVGFGLIETERKNITYITSGVITTPKTWSDQKRLAQIHEDLKTLIKKHKPGVIALEKLFFTKNVSTGITVAQARGVIMLTAEEAGIRIIECSPQDVKMSVAGYGKADKKQVQKMVTQILGLSSIPKPDDAADALAAAVSVTGRLKLAQYK
ncbi:MAG TPA: crossover junction endodeoxyribonuclease RuvC [Flavobacterium sp.]|nr:crossover junction endodeoxyribonuclease RuvC [Flavobacterium sp.]